MSKLQPPQMVKETVQDTDGQWYEIPFDVNLPEALKPGVIMGYLRAVKRRASVTGILNKQAEKYPTADELDKSGQGYGQPVTGPSPAEVKDYSPTQMLGYAASGAADALGAAASGLNRPPTVPTSIQQMKQSPPLENISGMAGGVKTATTDLLSSDPRQRAQGAVETSVNTLPLVYGAAKVGQGITGNIMDRINPKTPTPTAMEEKIAPTAKETRLSTERIAPELAKDPDLAAAKPGTEFDTALFAKFKSSETAIDTAVKNIPNGTMVKRTPITDELESVAAKYEDMGATEAAAAVRKEAGKWEAKPTDVPFDDYLTARRRLGTQMRTMNQFRETGTAAEKATGAAMREAYRTVVRGSDGLSAELTAANKQYSLLHTAMDDAGISFRSGRRISGIGSPIPTTLQKLKPLAVKGAIGAGGAALYEALKPKQ